MPWPLLCPGAGCSCNNTHTLPQELACKCQVRSLQQDAAAVLLPPSAPACSNHLPSVMHLSSYLYVHPAVMLQAPSSCMLCMLQASRKAFKLQLHPSSRQEHGKGGSSSWNSPHGMGAAVHSTQCNKQHIHLGCRTSAWEWLKSKVPALASQELMSRLAVTLCMVVLLRGGLQVLLPKVEHTLVASLASRGWQGQPGMLANQLTIEAAPALLRTGVGG